MLFVPVITLLRIYPKKNLEVEDVLCSVVYNREKLQTSRAIQEFKKNSNISKMMLLI